MTIAERERVHVHGNGLVASIVARHLTGRELRPQTSGSPPSVLIFVARADDLGDVPRSLDGAAPDAVLAVGLWRSWAYVGPFWRPGTPGCPRCLFARIHDSSIGPGRQDSEVVFLGRGDGVGLGAGPAMPHIVATLVGARIDGSGLGGSHPHRVQVYDTQTGRIDAHVLIPDARCAVCGPAARDTLPVFGGAARPLTKVAPRTLRVKPLDHDVLMEHVSPLGLFRRQRIDLQSPFGAATIELPETSGRPREPALGRAVSYRQSRAVAVLEGLERYCGMHCGGRRTALRAAYGDVADRAVYPPSLGAHPAASYALPGFVYRQFAPDFIVDWVQAYSFARAGPVLVPERTAFWGPRYDGETAFFYETSNGCALGGCAEEATLHGLLELVERDSFLLTWYRQLRLPELDLHGDPDPELRSLLRKCELFAQCTFRAFISTMEHGIPSVWLSAQRHNPRGPAVLAGAAAHLDLRQAVLGGLFELTNRVRAIAHYYDERRPYALRMLDDPFSVQQLEHHAMVNCLPEARSRFAFLLDRNTDRVALADAVQWRPSDDLHADLAAAVESMAAAGLDVLVVDQSMPETARSGLACVKVLVPGLLPMTFGHVNRRTEHLPRLTDPTALPYDGMPTGADTIYLPHPFD